MAVRKKLFCAQLYFDIPESCSVHIHSGDGSDTCDGCEPALVQAFYHRVTSAKRKSEENDDEVAEKQFSVEEKRRMINKMMKQEMGLQVGILFLNLKKASKFS